MTKFLEENLNMPLREVLAIMQDRIMNQTTYLGVKALKNPLDHWVYQELICEVQPDVIIEIGNANGGSTLSLAHICDLLGRGKIIGIDISHGGVPEHVKNHRRITFIEGDASQCFVDVEKLVSANDRVLIIEDSSHTYQNTLNILRTYSVLLKLGDYFIVEDSICHHGLSLGPKPGPYEAIETFMKENREFEIDRSRESFLITWNPKGYLRRVSLGETKSE
ncbi:MAG: CmcI family methyltransferase [Chloroflexota bacterium]